MDIKKWKGEKQTSAWYFGISLALSIIANLSRFVRLFVLERLVGSWL